MHQILQCRGIWHPLRPCLFRENLSRVEWSAFYSRAQLFSIIKRASVSTRRLIVTFREQFYRECWKCLLHWERNKIIMLGNAEYRYQWKLVHRKQPFNKEADVIVTIKVIWYVTKVKFLTLWDLLGYFERTTSERPTCQKLALWGKLSRRY